MLAIDTDMRAPKDVNIITLSVLVNNQVKVNYQGRVTPEGKVLLPATVALAEPDDENASIRIRVVAFQEKRARVLRDVRTTIPKDGRIALLRLPLKFVDDGSGQGELPIGFVVDDVPVSGGSDDGGAAGSSSGSGGSSSGDLGAFGAGEFDPYTVVQSSCPLDQTSIDGECKDDYVDSNNLPDYDESLVGKGDDPAVCFDVAKCFAGAQPIGEAVVPDGGAVDASASAGSSSGSSDGADASIVPDAGSRGMDFQPRDITLDRAACALNLNGADASQLNVAIVTSDTGECIRANECYIPIDSGEGGWTVDGGRVQLPSFVCTLITKKGLHLAISQGCAAKKASNPICAATTDEKPPPSTGTGNDGGHNVADSGVPPEAGATRVVAESFPVAVLMDSNVDVWFASSVRVGKFNASTPGNVSNIALPAGAPTGKQPWVLSPFGTGTVVSGLGLTTATASTGWVLNGADAAFTAVPVGQSPMNGAGEYDGGYVWGVGGQQGGVYTTATGTTGPATFFELAGFADVTYVIADAALGGLLYGTSTGTLRACNLQAGCPDQGTLFGDGARIDGVARDPRPSQSIYGFVLTDSAVWSGQLFTTNAIVAGKSWSSQTAGLTDGGQYYRHGIATGPQAPGCVFFTSQRGVEWASVDLTTGGVLVPIAPALGVWVGPGPGAYSVYYTVFDDAGANGGIWRVPVPSQCTTTSGGGGDAGGGPAPGGKDASADATP